MDNYLCSGNKSKKFRQIQCDVSLTAIQELPSVFQRTGYFTDWHLDAKDRNAMAGLQYDRVSPVTRGCQFCRSDTNIPARTCGWCSYRQMEQIQGITNYPDYFNDSGISSCLALPFRFNSDLAYNRIKYRSWLYKCF